MISRSVVNFFFFLQRIEEIRKKLHYLSLGGKISVFEHFVRRMLYLVGESDFQANALSGIKWQIFLCLYLRAKYLKTIVLPKRLMRTETCSCTYKVSIKFWILSRRKSESACPNIFKLLEKKDTKAGFFLFKKPFKHSCDFFLILTRPLWKIYFEQRHPE